ncbi:hypothetical protein TMES_18945 [Thalassospira mesophila]|uniref:Uncharacterized protein n=1 Tax=Thalassospira mesophila TaxID=1293891 RepID=A0A1Y2KW26_9PROT|nr:hypothetical protein TMES_18945 [Thalassospira mesophila]
MLDGDVVWHVNVSQTKPVRFAGKADNLYQFSMRKTHGELVRRDGAARLVKRLARGSEKPARRLRASLIGFDQ